MTDAPAPDPYRLLGVPPTADDASIRAAYLEAVRQHPPERDGARFEQVRAAYEAIASAQDRMAHALFDSRCPTAADLVAELRAGWTPAAPSAAKLRALLGSA